MLQLADGKQIEAVFIPDTPAQTFCVSTQVGCAMGCAFCLTGKMGLVRNLSAAEITAQVRLLAQSLDLLDKSFNIVLMGMGEPLHNYDATMKALRMLNEKEGLALHPKRVTLSTVGLVPMMDKLAGEELMPNLAVSLHAATEETRAAIVPSNKKYSMQDVIDACKRFPLAQAPPHHVRVRDARRRERLAAGRAQAGEGAVGRQGQGQPAAAQRRAGHPVRAAVGRRDQCVREDPGRQGAQRVGAQEPRPRHSRRVRTVDCRRAASRKASGANGWPRGMNGARSARSDLGFVDFVCFVVACLAHCLPAAAPASRSRGRTLKKQLPGLESEQRDAAIEKFIAAKGGTPIIENQTRLVFFAKDVNGATPRVVGDFNAWAATPQGYDAAIGKMTRIDGTNWSYLEGTSYTNARAEYVFFFDEEAAADPLNPRTVQAYAGPRSEIRMPFWVRQPGGR